jgi:Flp pilus assembly protein TadG
MRRTTANRRRRARGTTLVETALVLSLLMMFLMAIFEYGRYLMITQVLANAARDGVRYAASNVDKSNSFVTVDEGGRTNITAYVRSECYGLDTKVENFQVTVFPCKNSSLYLNPPVIEPKTTYTSWNQASFTERIAVQITAKYRPILPVVWLPGSGGSGFHVNLFSYGTGDKVVDIKIAAASGSEG